MAAAAVHHHLPRSYQLRFSVAGRVWVFDRVTKRFRQDTPRNVAAARDDYTIRHADGRMDSRVETEFLSRLDDRGAVLLEKLNARSQITMDEKEDFSWYLAFSLVRGPRFKRMLNEIGTAMWKSYTRSELQTEEAIREMIEECPHFSADERAAADPALLLEMIQSEDYTMALNRDYAVKLMMDHGAQLRHLFLESDWVVGHASRSTEFVTSDSPIVTLGSVRAFPLGHDSCLMMVPGSGDRIAHRDMPDEMVHQTNLDTARQAERTVIGTEDYLRRVVAESRIDVEDPAPIAGVEPPSV